MAAARVILVSDSHLSASAPQAQANWDAVVSYVGASAPDLVIHLGDLAAGHHGPGLEQFYQLQQPGRGREHDAQPSGRVLPYSAASVPDVTERIR